MNKQEKEFLESIKNKIQKYNIPISVKKALEFYSGKFIETEYNDGSKELVDANIEWILCKLSAFYFIANYGWIEFPGIGIIPYNLYYFQKEVLKDTGNFKKMVFLKSRQAGISTLYSLYSFWRGNFHEAESIDVISIKQKKAQAFTKKMFPTMDRLPEFLKTPIVKKNTFEIEWANGSYMLSESASDKAGRGDSLSLLILDELAFYRSDALTRGIVSAAQPTLTRTGGSQILISCVIGSTYIFTENGIEQVIDYKPNECKLGFNEIKPFKIDGIEHQQLSNTFYDSGKTPTIKITTQNKFENEISEIHPFYIIDENSPFPYWKQAKEINIGDYALFSCREKTFGNNNYIGSKWVEENNRISIPPLINDYITEDFSYFLGLIIGDGYIYFKNQNVTITSIDKETEDFLINKLNAFKEKDSIHFRIQGKHLINLLRYLGFNKKKAKEKTIPKRLLQMSRENISALLRGLFDSDGHSRTRDGSIGYTSTSKELIDQIKIILNQFGIQVSDERWNTISPEKSTKVNVESYVGQITLSRYFSKLFYEKIGFGIKRKQEKYEMVKHIKYSKSVKYPELNYWIKNNLINKHINNVLSQKLGKEYRKGWVQPNRKLRCGEKSSVNRETVKYILDYYDGVLNHTEEYQRLLNFYEKDWYPIKIKSVENSYAHTYDFVIPKTKSFYANGQITHNTPNGTSGAGSYYYEQVEQLRLEGGETETEKLVEIDWFEVPDIKGIKPYKGYNKTLLEYIKRDYYHNPKVRKEMKDFFSPVFESWKQNEWLKKQHDDLGPILFKQEIGHDFVISGDQVFADETLEAIKNTIKDPVEINKLGKTRINGLYIWKYPIPKQRYIIGVDVSSGTGDDYSSIQVMNVETYEQVAEYKGQLATKTFGVLVKKIARYYNEAYTVIEANSIGEAVFNEVYYNEEDSYQNVYRTKKSKNGIVRMTGWETTVKSRQIMINNLIDWFTVDELLEQVNIYSKRLYQEMITFVWRNGRADHASNSHDDTLIAFGLCLYFRNKAENAGESFLVSEDGDFIGTDNKKDLDDVKLNKNEFDFSSSDDDDFEEDMGMSKEDYEWLIG